MNENIDNPIKMVSTVSINTLNKYETLTTYKNYDCHVDNVLEQLDKYGVAVIPNVLDQKEVSKMKEGIWDTLEYLSSWCDVPINRNNPESWKTWYKFHPAHNMLLQNYSVGHAQFIWNIRQNTNVVNVFSKIWSTKPEDLITSYDALSFHLPPEITGKGWYKDNDWFHVDASYTRTEFDCVQGFVTGYDINEDDATLSVLEGSHKLHSKYAENFEIKTENDWNRLSNEDLEFYYENNCTRYNVKASAGSLVLWDSRTVHCGMEPLKTRKEPNFRLVTYVCMTPRSKCNEKTLEFRRNAFDNLYMTTHCPHRPRLFSVYPSNSEVETPEFSKPELTDLGKRLAGF
jgi:ectoine hydroxylase-related dioxygenase (phytanoyl-CoA dioxygenase family)